MRNNNAESDKFLTSFVYSMLNNLPDVVFVKNRDLIYVNANQSFAELVGVESADDIVGKTDAQIFDDASLVRRYTADDRRLMENGVPFINYIEPLYIADGSHKYFNTSKFPIFDEKGQILGLYAISRDVTREYLAKLNYEQELRVLFRLPDNALAGALFDITNWRLIDLKLVGSAFHTAANDESVDQFIQVAIHTVEEDEEACQFYRSFSRENLQRMYEDGRRHLTIEYRRRLPNNSVHWVRAEFHFLLDPVNGNLSCVWILKDIEAKKQAEHALTRAAEWDALTNVYNREATMTHIRSYLNKEGRDGSHWLYMIDVDNFKLINDSFGHQTGDDTLVDIAASIRRIFREGDIVGRVGGDEFFALMKDTNEYQTAAKRAQDLLEALQYVCAEEHARVELSGSVGISHYAGDGKTLERLYMEADSALYQAKKAGKNRYAFAEMADVTDLPDSSAGQGPINAVHLRTLLENMDAAMFLTELAEDNQIHVTYSSHSLFQGGEAGFIENGAQGEDIWSAILPEDLEPLKEAIRKDTMAQESLDHVLRIRNAKGQIEWRHIRGSHLPDTGDHIGRMIHVATDITRQKEIEAKLREKDRIIDFAMRNTDVNLWYFDYENAQCQLTPSCQKTHEMPGVEILENFPECLIEMGYVREDCVDLLRNSYHHLQETGESMEFDIWFQKADGSGWWCERDMLSPLFGPDGTVIRGIGIGKNVTIEKEMEEKFHVVQSYQSYMDFVVNRLLQVDYEFLGLMDVITGYLLVFGDSKDVDGMARNGSYYDTEMPRVFERLLVEEYRQEAVCTMARSHVMEELKYKEEYACSFPVRDYGNTKAGCKQWKFLYLDASKSQILMTRTDITNSYNRERDAFLAQYK